MTNFGGRTKNIVVSSIIASRPQPEAHGPDRAFDPNFATTLAHGLEVLAAFHAGEEQLSNAEIAVRVGLSRPTVTRLTHTLRELGYLRRSAKGKFGLGLRVLATAYPLLASLHIRRLARPYMRDYAAYAGGTVSLAMPFGLDYIYIETVRMTDSIAHLPDIGFTAPLSQAAAGRALLSLYTDDELTAYVARTKRERPHESEGVETRTLPEVESCRARGFAMSIGEWRPEIFGVAAPLFRTPGGECVAVNCGIPAFRFSPEQIESECGPRMLGLANAIKAAAQLS